MPLGPEATEGFERLLDELDPALVVFDSWVNCLAACGLDENSAVDIATWADAYAPSARMRDAAVLILDHVPKEGTGARGSGRKRDYVDVMWELRNPQKFDRRTVGRIDLHLRKDREGWLPPALTFGVGGVPEGFVFRRGHGTIVPAEEAGLSAKERSTLKALEALGGTGASDGEWKAEAEKHRGAKSTYYNARRRLLDLNLVEKATDKYFAKHPQNLGPDKSNGLRMDPAGGVVQRTKPPNTNQIVSAKRACRCETKTDRRMARTTKEIEECPTRLEFFPRSKGTSSETKPRGRSGSSRRSCFAARTSYKNGTEPSPPSTTPGLRTTRPRSHQLFSKQSRKGRSRNFACRGFSEVR
jgi:hypothetical protein